MTDQVTPESGPKGTLTPTPELRFEMSATIGTLIGALAKARKQFKAIVKTEINPFFKSKYADLANVIDATVDGLSDNGLAILQPPAFEKSTGTVEILTLLAHSSGEWMKAILEIPIAKGDAQGVGAAITYGRRYSYSGVLNVASEHDDDGNAASGKKNKDLLPEETDEQFDQRTEDQKCLLPFEITAIDEACKRTGKTEQDTLTYLALFGEKRIEHLSRNQFKKFLEWANSTGKSKANGKQVAKVTDSTAAMKKLFATANDLRIPENDVKRASYEKFGVDSMTKLSVSQLEEMTTWVKEVAQLANEA